MIIQEAQSDGLLLQISHSCLALDVSRSGYYEWLRRSEKIPAENSESSDLINQIQEIALEFPYQGCSPSKVLRKVNKHKYPLLRSSDRLGD